MNLELIWMNALGTEHNLGTVGDFINKIYRPDPDVPRGEVLTDAATQLAITLILDAPKDEILN